MGRHLIEVLKTYKTLKTTNMTQQFFFEDEEPQPYPSDLINLLKEEAKERPPKCSCNNPPSDGCIC